MAEIANVTVDYTVSPRIINIPDAAGDITIQDAWDTLSEIASRLENLMFPKLIDRPKGGGKGVLSVTKSIGITLPLNNAKIKFFDQPGPAWIIKRVVDGNVTAADDNGTPIEPLENSDFTNWKNEADVSAAILETGVSGLTAQEAADLRQMLQILRNKRIVNDVNGKEEIFTDDDLAVLISGDAFEDAAGTVPFGPLSKKVLRRNKLT